MKRKRISLTSEDVRYIITDTLEQTGLDKVPKKLETLDKILESVDKLEHLHLTF